jgi:hypothetical protein
MEQQEPSETNSCRLIIPRAQFLFFKLIKQLGGQWAEDSLVLYGIQRIQWVFHLVLQRFPHIDRTMERHTSDSVYSVGCALLAN